MDRLYDVIIDRSSTIITVSGEDEDEAAENALEIFKKNHKDNFNYWVGDVDKQGTWEE